MNDKKINLESICKELGLDLTGDVFVAINPTNLKTTHVYINAQYGVINAISEERKEKLKCIANELFGEENSK